MDSQLKKGLIEYCVLASLVEIDSYGYQIVKEIHPQLEITESTLYPILKVSTYSKVHNGRLRKYYHLTDLGFASIQKFLQEWNDVEAVHNYIKRSVEE